MYSAQIDELKKVVRSLLILEKSNGLSLRMLEHAYGDIEGRSIPLCGFPDTAALLHTLTDTVYTVGFDIIISFFFLVRRQIHSNNFFFFCLFAFGTQCTRNIKKEMKDGQIYVYPVVTENTKYVFDLVRNSK